MANLADKSIRDACWRGGFADATSLYLGDSNDVGFQWDGTNLILTAAADDSLIEIGDSATTQLSFDLKWYGGAASGASYIYADASANLIYTTGVDLQFKDNDYLVLGTGAGAAGDVNLVWDGTDLHMNAAANNTVFNIGDGTTSFDIKTFGSAAANYILWDASANALQMQGAAFLEFVGASSQNPINMDSIGDFATATTSGTLGNVIKMDLTGAVTHQATTAGLVVKNYAESPTIDGNYEFSAIIGMLKHKATLSGGAKSSLMSLHRHSSSTGTIDYGIRMFAEDNKLTTFLYGSGTMTNFLEAVASGAAGVTVSSDGMTKNPENDTEDGYLTVLCGGTSYQVPMYAA